MHPYEMMVIINPDLEESEISDTLEKLSNLIKNNAGKLENLDEWGRRTMAYEINHKKEGYYAVFYFEGEAALPDKIRRELRLNPNLLRGMIIRRDE